jgi:hypothetical protein
MQQWAENVGFSRDNRGWSYPKPKRNLLAVSGPFLDQEKPKNLCHVLVGIEPSDYFLLHKTSWAKP